MSTRSREKQDIPSHCGKSQALVYRTCVRPLGEPTVKLDVRHGARHTVLLGQSSCPWGEAKRRSSCYASPKATSSCVFYFQGEQSEALICRWGIGKRRYRDFEVSRRLPLFLLWFPCCCAAAGSTRAAHTWCRSLGLVRSEYETQGKSSPCPQTQTHH